MQFLNTYSRIIQECLGIWARSPTAYAQLRNSGLLLLPSPSILTKYKNSMQQSPGIQPAMLDWMKKEAERCEVPNHRYWGGLLFDECSLQVCRKYYSFIKFIVQLIFDDVSLLLTYKKVQNK